jgi:hypothetical protein
MAEYAGKRHTYLLKLNNEEFIDSTRYHVSSHLVRLPMYKYCDDGLLM